MTRVGLKAWIPYFEKHLPANIKTIQSMRGTTAADLERMAMEANMLLPSKTTKLVLDRLAKR